MKALLTLSLIAAFTGLAAPAQAVEVGDAAPCVVLNHLVPDGKEAEHCIREPNKAGQFKILEFFSATCSACARNLPIVSALAERVKETTTTRLVGIDRSEGLLRDYVASHADLIHFEVALDTNRDAKRAYDVVATPTLFVLDANDQVVFKHEGVLSEDDVAAIESIVKGGR